jgi:two-component system chemotaxis response regulator CheY
VLVVDDSISTRALIGRTLKGAGYSVQETTDGLEALEALADGAFDMIMTDQWMPNMTGVELVLAVRAQPRFAHVPILAITTDGEDLLSGDILDAGASACVLKPFEPRELLEAVGRIAEHQ